MARRRSFDAAGALRDTHGENPDIVRAVAAEKRVPFIDMQRKSEEVLRRYGPEASRKLCLQLKAGENANYRDITMKDVGVAVTLNLFYFDKAGQRERQAKPITATTPVVRGVRIVNVTVEGAKAAGGIVGLPEMPISDVLLENVRINSKTGMIVQDAKAVEMRARSDHAAEGQATNGQGRGSEGRQARDRRNEKAAGLGAV